eukprot:CAMPEP_0180776826 /NCGR_PEP_ID=MMETSP1038_2-20121128/44992_1 /TAXON_ID=632150 /ORGANISM="Azadinium spinosum, Strain 3D9" /LENGTH=77 /DNA_ID=CAMNT_0022811943 /DNA_START=43 /DNA_END=273 /DNA_ORIENTATION=-
MTNYVCTRWYRAPEVLCCESFYSTAMDVWSVGCIFAELLKRGQLFPGGDTQEQLVMIMAFLGTPEKEELAKVPSSKC